MKVGNGKKERRVVRMGAVASRATTEKGGGRKRAEVEEGTKNDEVERTEIVGKEEGGRWWEGYSCS